MERDLKTVLEGYPAQSRPWDEPVSLGNAGGLSGSRLWRFQSGRGLLVARAWPTDGPPAAQLDRVHAWLNSTAHLGFVPVPLANLVGRTYVERSGRLWEVTSWLPGAADPSRPPAPSRLEAAFIALAAFHQSLAVHRVIGPSPGILMRLEELRGLLRSELNTIETAIRKRPSDPLVATASHWVDIVRNQAPELIETLARASAVVIDRQPILRDARPEHFLFEEDRVSGLVDFGAMGVDTVAADLARLISEWIDPADLTLRSQALSAYESIRAISPSEHMLFQAIERSTTLLGPGRWVRWHFVEERAFHDREAVARGLSRSMERLNSAIAGLSRTCR